MPILLLPPLTKGDWGGFLYRTNGEEVPRAVGPFFFRMDLRYHPVGVTTGLPSAKPHAQFHLTLSINMFCLSSHPLGYA